MNSWPMFQNLKLPDLVLVIVVLFLIWAFWKAQRDTSNVFNLFDLIMENGRLSRAGVAFMAVLCITSWAFVRAVLDGKMNEGYFTSFGAMWVAPLIAKMFSGSPPAPPLGTTTNTVDSSTTSTTVVAAPDAAPVAPVSNSVKPRRENRDSK